LEGLKEKEEQEDKELLIRKTTAMTED